jgi:hypothetical protein
MNDLIFKCLFNDAVSSPANVRYDVGVCLEKLRIKTNDLSV